MRKLIFLFLILLSSGAFSYTLNLVPEKPDYIFKNFFLNGINDKRSDQSSAGTILVQSKVEKALFNKSLSEDLSFFILNLSKPDTSSIPIILDFTEFMLKESGSSAGKHVITLSYKISFFRERDGKRFELYQVSGSPAMTINGHFPKAYEKLIGQALSQSLKGFDEWLGNNLDYPSLLKTVKVIFEKSEKFKGSPDTIQWTSDYKLKWDDFQGKPEESPFSANSNCMFTYSARPEGLSGVLNLHISLLACFGIKSSWVKPDTKQDTLLMHEQLHFDICELYVRKLKKQLSELQLSPVDFEEPIKKLFDEGWSQYQIMQVKYDDETQHGIISAEQIRWMNTISQQLEETKSFSE